MEVAIKFLRAGTPLGNVKQGIVSKTIFNNADSSPTVQSGRRVAILIANYICHALDVITLMLPTARPFQRCRSRLAHFTRAASTAGSGRSLFNATPSPSFLYIMILSLICPPTTFLCEISGCGRSCRDYHRNTTCYTAYYKILLFSPFICAAPFPIF